MKGLLHSKIFKNNLKKWLCMYVGVLLLLTSVVTYSKYISTFMADAGEARVTKFNVKIENADSKRCETLIDETTKLSYLKCKPDNVVESDESDETIRFYFNVNTNEVEVVTDLVVTVNINESFNFISIKEKNYNKYVNIVKATDSKGNTIKNITMENNKAILYNLINESTRGIKTYEVVVKYKNGFTIDPKDFDAVTIDYSAKQIPKVGGVSNE